MGKANYIQKSVCKPNRIFVAVLVVVFLSLFFWHYSFPWRSLKIIDCATTSALDVRYVEENFNKLDQYDRQLIDYTRVRFMTPPPPSDRPYNLKNKRGAEVKNKINTWVVDFFGNMTNGTFIETGANDGEFTSNTLYLETQLGWRGLLIECNPTLVPVIIKTHRRVWVGGVCIALGTKAGIFNFEFHLDHSNIGLIADRPKPITEWYKKFPADTFLEVPGVPLYTILASIGITEVDFFSLDIEGQDLQVLRVFPFDKVMFKVICVEVKLYKEKEMEELNALFQRNNYTLAKQWPVDNIYVHNSVAHMIPKSQ